MHAKRLDLHPGSDVQLDCRVDATVKICIVCRIDHPDMTDLAYHSPTDMLLKPLVSVVASVIKLVGEQKRVWKDYKFEICTLERLWAQTNGHRRLLLNLGTQPTGKLEQADGGEVIGTLFTPHSQGMQREHLGLYGETLLSSCLTYRCAGKMLRDYKQLEKWLCGWSAASVVDFARLPNQGARMAKAKVYAKELDVQKEMFGNAFVKHLGDITVVVSSNLIFGNQ